MLNAMLSNLCAVEAMIPVLLLRVLYLIALVSFLIYLHPSRWLLTAPCAKDMPSAFFEVRGRNILSRSFTVFY
jgi:hypothetical protein